VTTQSRPNTLFLLVDCLRADHLGRRARAPRLTRLRRSGLNCTQMIAAATTTTPCVASIMTGTYSPRHGIRSLRGYRLRPDLPTLAECLHDAGYHTHAEVTGPLLPAVGLDRGFISYEYRSHDAYLDTAWGDTLRHRLTAGPLPRPWFAFVHLWELHQPRRVRPGFDSLRYGRSGYARAVASLDALLAPLLAALGEDTLVIIHGDHGEQLPVSRRVKRFYRWQRKTFGRPFPPWPSFPLREGHGFDVWEDIIRVPFLMHHPRLVSPGSLTHQTRQVDVMPTILDVLKVPVPAGIDGVSVLRASHADTPGASVIEPDAFIEACGETIVDPLHWRRGIRTARWKYIETAGGTRPRQLYDLRQDPRERHNVADAHPSIVADLRTRLTERLAVDTGEDVRLGTHDQQLLDTRLRALGYLE
jgi:arylsulfatase A-like enzyme